MAGLFLLSGRGCSHRWPGRASVDFLQKRAMANSGATFKIKQKVIAMNAREFRNYFKRKAMVKNTRYLPRLRVPVANGEKETVFTFAWQPGP